MTVKSGNIYQSSVSAGSKEVVEQLVAKNSLKIEKIASMGHSSPATGWYDQDDNEWVVVLKGDAIVAFEDGKKVRMGEGDYLDIPAHTRHKVEWTSPDIETIWLAVHY